MVDLDKPHIVSKQNLLYKCGWSPLEGFTFPASILKTMVNGNIVFENDSICSAESGKRLVFDRN